MALILLEGEEENRVNDFGPQPPAKLNTIQLEGVNINNNQVETTFGPLLQGLCS
jgi:hypothetical protein